MVAQTEKALKELVARGIKIPAQPKVLLKLQEKLVKNDFNVRVIARIVAEDPGISAMLFKAARSPLFGGNKKLETIEQVLMVIGLKQTCNLVQAIALSSALSDSSRKSFEIFWTRSQEVAQMAALIAADRVSVCNVFPDQAYMAGIFHECGVPVLMQRFPDYCQSLPLEKACCWPELTEEDKRFNVDHASIGYLVARHWKLPDFVCQALQYHHEMPHEEHGAVRTLVGILLMAIHFYLRVTRVDNPLWAKVGAEVLDELCIHRDGEQEYYEIISERFLERGSA